ncbi:MAG: acyl--CoA ligase [Actinobacteria bacterium]|nr:acyl--CoA ligase [Actinomycetota bacterium]
MIKGGENILPEDIERVAHCHPGIADVAAVGRSDPFYGEVVEMFVVWRTNQTERTAELMDLLRARLPRTWWPRRIHTVARIPRTPSGKVIRSSLTVESPE